MRHAHPHQKWIAHNTRLFRKCSDEFVRMDKTDVGAMTKDKLKRDLKVDHLQLVFDKRSAGFAAFSAPFDVCKRGAVPLRQKPRTQIVERVDNGSGT